MFKTIDQFIFIPVSIIIVVIALAWLVNHPATFLIAIGLMGVVFSVLVVKQTKHGK